MNSIFLIGIAQALFFVVLLISKKGKALSDKVLIAWLLFIGAHLFMAYGDVAQWHQTFPHWLGLSFPFPAAEGPFFFLYVLTLTRNPSRIRWYDYLHFFPFLLIYLISWEFFSSSGPEKLHFMQVTLWENPPLAVSFANVLLMVTGPAYALYILWELRAHRKKVRALFSAVDAVDLLWIRNLAIGMCLIWVMVWVANAGFQGGSNFRGVYLIFITVTLFVFAIGYFGVKQGRIFAFAPTSSPPLPPVTLEPQEAPEKYQKSGLKQQDQQTLLAHLLTYMKEEKPYLNPQLTLGELAASTQFSPHHLSQLINEGMNQNFFEFVNQHRVSAFQTAIAQPSNKHLTLLAIAMDCGFNSKSSFNRTFKQLTGQTPSQYAKGIIN